MPITIPAAQVFIDQVQALANEMGVTYSDVLSMARGVATGIAADGITDVYVSAPDIQAEFCQEYAADHVKKMDMIQVKCLTRSDCAQAMRDRVLSLLIEQGA